MSDDFKPVHELTARQGRSIEIRANALVSRGLQEIGRARRDAN